jgi:hypothetical protein
MFDVDVGAIPTGDQEKCRGNPVINEQNNNSFIPPHCHGISLRGC